MGLIISRFRKHKSAKEKLQSISKEIKDIEQFSQFTQERQRNIVGRFVLTSVFIFITGAVAFYFWALPERLLDRLLYITPFIFFPFIIVFLKRIITWYYSRKIRKNETRLTKLKDEKKKLLDDVMDNETYKTAKEILEQFAPEQLRKDTGMTTSVIPFKSGALVAKQESGPLTSSPQDLRRRTMMPPPTPQQRPGAPTPGWRNPQATPMTPYPQMQRSSLPPGPPMPRPVLPRDRSVMDRLVEFIVGDGPGNRYALVCRQCSSHNGMALQEEFEYLAFRCCYCYAWNPARKQRPQAPLLPTAASSQEEEEGGESSASTAGSEAGEDAPADTTTAEPGDDAEPSETAPPEQQPTNEEVSGGEAQPASTEVGEQEEQPTEEAAASLPAEEDKPVAADPSAADSKVQG